MKKLILLTALLVSVVCGKSIEQLQSELGERYRAIIQKESGIFQQNDKFQRLAPHCQGGKGDKGACRKIINLQDKYCQNGFVSACGALALNYLQDGEAMGIKIDENQAKSYADKVCNLDAVVCVFMSMLFIDKNLKIALKYAEKACKMGEPMGCFGAWWIYNKGGGGIAKNPQKAKYYESKLCKAGVNDFCK